MHCEGGLSWNFLFHGGNTLCDRIRVQLTNGCGSATTNGAEA